MDASSSDLSAIFTKTDQVAQFQAIFNAISDGVVILNARGETLQVNTTGRKILGMTADDPVSRTSAERVTRRGLRDADGRFFTEETLPSARILSGEILAGPTAQTMFVRATNDDERIVSLTGAPLRDAENGGIVGAVAVFRDITELKRAQEALAEERRLFRTLVENSPDIVTRHDRHLRLLYASPNSAASVGIPASAQLGKTYAELGFSEAEAQEREDAMRIVFATGRSYAFEQTSQSDIPGQHVWRVTYAPEFAPDGSVESALGITTDITELKRVEEELRAAKTIAEVAQQQELQRRHEVERREKIAESLRDVLTILNSDRHVANVFEFITRQARRLLNSDAAAIFSLNTNRAHEHERARRSHAKSMERGMIGSLRLEAAVGLPAAGAISRGKQRVIAGDAAVRLAISTQKPVAVMPSPAPEGAQTYLYLHSGGESRLITPGQRSEFPVNERSEVEDATSPDFIEVRKQPLPHPYRALLAIPIVTQLEVYGSLLLLYTAPRSFSPDEVALAMAYSDQIALAIANAELQDHIERSAREAERNQLARDLHDTVTQEIFSASVLADSIPLVWNVDRGAAEARLQQVGRLTHSALAALRALLVELRPAMLEQKPLADLLRQLGEVMTMRIGTAIELTIEEHCPPIPLAVKIAYYRIAQEALMNAAKHASAQHISLRLSYLRKEEVIQLVVQDDGQGFDMGSIPVGHFGLGMMRERASASGASLRTNSRRGHGTRIAVRWVVAGGERQSEARAATSQSRPSAPISAERGRRAPKPPQLQQVKPVKQVTQARRQ